MSNCSGKAETQTNKHKHPLLPNLSFCRLQILPLIFLCGVVVPANARSVIHIIRGSLRHTIYMLPGLPSSLVHPKIRYKNMITTCWIVYSTETINVIIIFTIIKTRDPSAHPAPSSYLLTPFHHLCNQSFYSAPLSPLLLSPLPHPSRPYANFIKKPLEWADSISGRILICTSNSMWTLYNQLHIRHYKAQSILLYTTDKEKLNNAMNHTVTR